MHSDQYISKQVNERVNVIAFRMQRIFTLNDFHRDGDSIYMNGIEAIAEFIQTRCDLVEAHVLPTSIALNHVHLLSMLILEMAMVSCTSRSGLQEWTRRMERWSLE